MATSTRRICQHQRQIPSNQSYAWSLSCKQHTWWAINVINTWCHVMLEPATHWCVNASCDLPLQWRHNGRDSVSNHRPHDCLLNRLFRRRSRKTSKLRVTGLCAGNSPGTGEFPAQMASNAENISIGWRHHALSHWGQGKIAARLQTTIISFNWKLYFDLYFTGIYPQGSNW